MTEQIEDKIEKLLRVADGTANENESAVALQMAQKLADLHNLDIGTIGKSGARKDERVSKGLYRYQRTLYASISRLNHCRSWITKGLTKGSKYEIRLLGSKVNVTITKNMCDYIEEVANRLVRENYEPKQFFSRDAHYFREGLVDRLVERIRIKREQEEAEREQAKREQEARMRHPGAASENAIILISDVAREEEKANYDYLHGEGSWDRLQEEIRAAQERREKAIAEYKAWELANPEEVARLKAEREREDEKRRKYEERLARNRERARQERIDRFGYDPQDYRGSNKPTKYDSQGYWDGHAKANDVNLDDQIDHQKRKAIG